MSNQKYWQGIEELSNPKQAAKLAKDEFRTELPFEDASNLLEASTSRRDFLKYLGFSTAAAVAAASCKIPERKARTWAEKPNDMTPGVALMYASTFVDGGEAIPVLVKTREGRPIKIEGNPDSTLYEGATSAKLQASVLSLYDVARLRQPEVAGKKANSWEDVDAAVASGMAAAAGAPVYLVTSTINSPSVRDLISKFTAKYANAKHVQYDAISYSGLLDAAAKSTGKRAIPHYDFGAAKTIVSIGADFLGTWVTPTLYAKSYSKGRKVYKDNPGLSKHYQIEGIMTTTGGAADERTSCRPSQYGAAAVALLGAVNGTAASTGNANLDKTLNKAAADLKKGGGLVVCGSNDVATQEVVFAINAAIGAYGTTMHPATSNLTKQGNDAEMDAFVKALTSGTAGGAIFYDCNPVYEHAQGAAIAKAIKGLKLSVSCSDRNDETAEHCNIKAPASHWLESWGDSEYMTGYVSLQQPTISTLFKTREFGESLLRWMGDATTSYKTFFNTMWQGRLGGINAMDAALQLGLVQPATAALGGGYSGSAAAAASAIAAAPKAAGKEVVVYEKIGLGRGGVWSNNPWLQEMPDPVTKCTWDNYIMISPKHAKAIGAELTDLNEVQREKKVMKVTVGGASLELPVVVVPGVHDDVIGIAVGYGRGKGVGRAATADEKQGGKNAYTLTTFANGTVSYANAAKIEDTGKEYSLAITQTHHSYEGRDTVVRETTYAKYMAAPMAMYEERMHELHHYTEDFDAKAEEIYAKAEAKHGGEHGAEAKAETHAAEAHTEAHGAEGHTEAHGAEAHAAGGHADQDIEKLYRKNGTLYEYRESNGLKWGLSVDLNSCTGCGACSIACQAENNVSVVGKQQVMLVHDMHWMRIDRYYTSTTGNAEDSDSIQTVFMPMMCQHCDNAPCENVCPVNASNHSSEGMNQMAYNRCIGTRYCANNCPFKVRRFNWRDWNGADSFEDNLFEDGYRDDINSDLTRMVLNPDVTVRSRGVIEKCSFCVQRTQAGKQKAKQENRALTDKDAQSACAQACPTNAITFGNVNDSESAISKLRNEQGKARLYYALEELHVLPNVNYLYKVRNADQAGAPHPGGEHEAHAAHGAEAAHTEHAAAEAPAKTH
jgi:MoCo/4Fe-4S cofactor protein with predicted Tat translocation signal